MTRPFAIVLAVSFLLANLVLRAHALVDAGPGLAVPLLLVVGVGAGACLARPALVPLALQLFAASFFLYGFHSYRVQSHVFELVASVLGLVLLHRLVRAGVAFGPSAARGGVAVLALAYALLAACSLLLLPAKVLEHRLFLEGGGFGRAVLAAFPGDPLYAVASVGRLWLFLLVAGLVAAQADGRALFRRLSRGVAWAALAAVVLGLLDFAGLVPLAGYNLSRLFYGQQYLRLQSTFSNPSWFACFVACALPLVWLEFHDARGRWRWAFAAAFPLCAAALFLSAARAAWIAALLVLAGLTLGALAARRLGRPLPPPDAATWLALGSTVLAVAVLAISAWTTPLTLDPERADKQPGRLESLSREMQYRGLGVDSPRRVAMGYALELARLKPVLGLGYETFNLHLRAQLAIPGSGVARVVNTAVVADASETSFDDSHNTYLQVLTGTGGLGLAVFGLLVLATLGLALQAFRRSGSPEALAVLLGLAAFHFYGLLQGMAYIPVTFFLLPLQAGYALTLASDSGKPPAPRSRKRWLAAVLGLAVAGGCVGYALDQGYSSLKRRFSVAAYLPDEAAEFEGFYRPETGPSGEFRWMGERGIVNLARSRPFRLRFTCDHPDAEREPVVLQLRVNGKDAGQVVFRRQGAIEQRFDFGSQGALRLSVSRTFTPPGADRRELGIAVSAIRWE